MRLKLLLVPVIFLKNVSDINNWTVCIFSVFFGLLYRCFVCVWQILSGLIQVRTVYILRGLPLSSRWLTSLAHLMLDILIQIEQVLLNLKLLSDLHRQLHILLNLLLLLLFLHKLLQLARGSLLRCLPLLGWVARRCHRNDSCPSRCGLRHLLSSVGNLKAMG